MGGWVLDLGDSGDAIHVMFVEVFSGMVFFFFFFKIKKSWGARRIVAHVSRRV